MATTAADVAVAAEGVRSTHGVRIPGDSPNGFADALRCRQGASVCLWHDHTAR